MKAEAFNADLLCDLVQRRAHGVGGQVAAYLIREDQVFFVLPDGAGGQLPKALLCALLLQDLQHRGRNRQRAWFVVLERAVEVLSFDLMELTIYAQRPFFEVDAVPRQREDFAHAQAGKQIDREQAFISAALDCV